MSQESEYKRVESRNNRISDDVDDDGKRRSLIRQATAMQREIEYQQALFDKMTERKAALQERRNDLEKRTAA
ncbi:unnamed protein product, partial [Didymodactylos carnosus]